MEPTFFGQTYDYMKISPEMVNQTYEQLFLMSYYMGWSFYDSYSLPIRLRNWFFDKWVEKKKSENEVVNN